MRLTAPAMAAELRDGLIVEGATVLDAGMVATEMLYHLVGSRELDGGAMVTASHNPKAYTGVKLVREGALALSGDAGIGDVRREIEAGLGDAPGGGSFEEVDIWDEFRAHALSFIDPRQVQADEGRRRRRQRDGRADGRADPAQARPRPGGDVLRARRRVPRPRAEPAAGGEPADDHRAGARPAAPTSASPGTATPTAASSSTATASFCDGDFICALLARAALAKNPGATILYDPRSSRAVPDLVAAEGGRSDLSRVGHAFFKARMREEGAAFGGEVSGHYYFRDFWNADSGTIPALLMLELLSVDGRTLAELMAEFRSRYFISGEINSEVADPAAKMEEIAERYADGEITRLDGVSVDYPDWHFNVRPSNTEPLLRLNLESLVSREDMEEKRDEVLGLIRA